MPWFVNVPSFPQRFTRRALGLSPFDITFCVGAPRSGTTLVASLLSEGPTSTPMLPECTYVTQLLRNYFDFVNYSDQQRFTAYARSSASLQKIYRRAAQRMAGTAASHFDWWRYKNIVFKDPELTAYVDLIPAFFGEDRKVVYVARNPADVVASLFKVYCDEEQPPDLRIVADSVYQYFWSIHESELMKSGNVHVIQFEKILAKEESEFERIEAYLGFAVGREGFAKVYFEPDRKDATYSENFGKPITGELSSKAEKYIDESTLEYVRTTFSGYNEIYNWW